ncbi:hypothetical protein BV898_14355 [Hypsibius exemplaris]|uniref:Receptor ligand binding region domain-containing protein n=1 Tax=Hypsibius exemplaris TaxID=2072580 RepID=A0A9X6RJH5_HYPEX|nr:hypothetical protein BV898_14355 [Hypsibius exemplaris]
MQMEEAVAGHFTRGVKDATLSGLSRILPFVFVLNFDDVSWAAVTNETAEMKALSLSRYNWTIPLDREHHVIRLAAYESALAAAQVLNESYEDLLSTTAQGFVRKFFDRSFDFPARKVKTSSTGSRLCDISVKQYHTLTKTFQTVLLFDNARLLLSALNESFVRWPSYLTSFPPSHTPTCRDVFSERCSTLTNQSNYIVLPVVIACVVVGVLLATAIFLRCRTTKTDVTWWTVQVTDIVWQRGATSKRASIFTDHRPDPIPEFGQDLRLL